MTELVQLVEHTQDATPASDSPIPDISERPVYHVLDDWVETSERKYKAGVYYFGVKEKNGESKPYDTWICSPLYVRAITRDTHGNNFGRELYFKPTIGDWRSWAMPMDMLAGDGRELRAVLLSMGLEMDVKNRTDILKYIQSQRVTEEDALLCATQTGWQGDCFVLPDQVIGPRADKVVFQAPYVYAEEYAQQGTLNDWRESVAALAPGNPLLLLALSAAFAGPLLQWCHAESGGLHLVGDSSTGKTGLLEAACSVWGGSNYKRTWRATSNGMEGAAALFNDGLLALDEISECDPREIGSIVYSLGNGAGKQRAGRDGGARSLTRWRCMILSNGERSVESAMLEGGQRAKAGQMVRILNLPATRTHGAWDNLHRHSTGAAFTDALKTAAKTHYGSAGRAFLEHLSNDTGDISGYFEEAKTTPGFSVEDGQHKRAAARLALIAIAGELATEYGITGWEQGAAITAAQECLKVWVSNHGTGPNEQRQALTLVSDFIDKHGDSRFSCADTGANSQVRDRAGWWRDDGERRIYLFTASGLRDALKSTDFKRGLEHLSALGALTDQGSTDKARTQRINGSPKKIYTIDPDKLEG